MTEQNMTTTQDDGTRELRSNCLKMAISNGGGYSTNAEKIVTAARIYEDYLTGANDPEVARIAREVFRGVETGE